MSALPQRLESSGLKPENKWFGTLILTFIFKLYLLKKEERNVQTS